MLKDGRRTGDGRKVDRALRKGDFRVDNPDQIVEGTDVPAAAKTLKRPIRTCIATRRRHKDSELLRVVVRRTGDDISVVPDPNRSMPGRGAWLTPTLEAWEIAEKRRAFGRALKVSMTVDADPVRTYLAKIGDPVERSSGGAGSEINRKT